MMSDVRDTQLGRVLLQFEKLRVQVGELVVLVGLAEGFQASILLERVDLRPLLVANSNRFLEKLGAIVGTNQP